MEDTQIFLYLNGELSKNERAKVKKWIQSNPGAFLQIKQIWESAKIDNQAIAPDPSKAWSSINLEISEAKQRSQNIRLYRNILKYAAIFIISIGLGFGGWSIMKPKYIEYSSNHDEIRSIELADGSKLWLNKDSKLIYRNQLFSSTREATLFGEAYFNIKKDPEKPFVITAGNTITKVLGTSFNIKSEKHDGRVMISVESGKVLFYEQGNATNKVYLAAGEGSEYRIGNKKLTKQKLLDNNIIAWKTKTLRFKDMPLSEVCKELSTYFDTSITVAQPGNFNNTLTAKYENKSLHEIIDLLELTLNVEARKTKSGIELVSNNFNLNVNNKE